MFIAATTGARRAEICAIKRDRDVDWDLVPNGGVTTLAVEAGRLRDQERLSRHQRRASGRTAAPAYGLDRKSVV